MAYIVGTTQTPTANAATYTVSLGAHISGDLLLMYLSQDGGGTVIAPDATSASAGWAMIGTQAASGASRSAWAYLIADSAAEVNPVFTGATDDWIGTCLVVRDAHATAPFGTLVSGTDFIRTDWNAVSSSASGALTSAVDECLLLYSWCSDGSNQYMRCKVADCVEVDKYNTTVINHIIGLRQQQTAAAAPTATMYNVAATEGGNGWVIAVRNKSGGVLQPDVRVTANELKWYGSWELTHDAVTWQAASAFAASINGITCTAVAPALAYINTWTDSPWGTVSNVAHSDNLATASIVGGVHTIASTDMTGKVFFAETAGVSVSATGAIASDGMMIGFSDGTNWVVYQTASKAKGWLAGFPAKVAIALGQATAYASSGSINWAAVTMIGYFYHRGTGTTQSAGTQLKNATLLDLAALTGGGLSRPVTLKDLNKYLNSWSHYQFTQIQASAQILIKANTQIGDGTNKTYFDGAAQSMEFPQAWSATHVANWQMGWNVLASQLSTKVKASASDTIKLAAGVAATETRQALTIDAASSTSAAYDFGQSFVGWSPTWKTGVPCIGATFASCGPVNFKGASISDTTIKNTLATASEAAASWDANGATVATSTIDVTGTAAGYHISLGASVTAITLNGVTLTGTPGTDKIYSALASGTLTITTDGTGTALVVGDVTFIGGSTAVAVIASPQVYQSVAISGFTAGTGIEIYDYGVANTQLFNGTASAGNTVITGSTAVWTDPAAASAQRDIRVRLTYQTGATAKEMIEANIGSCGVTESTKSVSYLATQVDDVTYNTNAIDGSTVNNITINDTTNKVEIAIPGGAVTWPQIYAYQVYWLHTNAGRADDFAFIEAPDTANYLLTGFTIKNTSSPTVPLVISSGYGRDSTTGASVDLVDTTGGTLIFAPDHVVAYSSGSGLTAGQDANLSAIKSATDAYLDASVAAVPAAILSAATTTPIAANIEQVNAVTIDGTGTALDPWGPQ